MRRIVTRWAAALRYKLRQRKMLRAFEAGDVCTVAKMSRSHLDPLVAEIGFHKARQACALVSPARREESLAWLKLRGFKTLYDI